MFGGTTSKFTALNAYWPESAPNVSHETPNWRRETQAEYRAIRYRRSHWRSDANLSLPIDFVRHNPAICVPSHSLSVICLVGTDLTACPGGLRFPFQPSFFVRRQSRFEGVEPGCTTAMNLLGNDTLVTQRSSPAWCSKHGTPSSLFSCCAKH